MRGEDVLDLARADADGERRERAMGAGVAVAANHRHAGQRRALLRADDVHDALAMVLHAEIGLHVELAHVLVERLDLQARDGVRDALVAMRRRDVVIRGGHDGPDAPRLAVGDLEAFERLGARHFMDEMTPEGFLSNNAGGILGGISTGQDIVVSIAIKPTSSIRLARKTVDVAGAAATIETHGRHDPCVGIRATPIAEAFLALVLMDHALRHRAQNADVKQAAPHVPAQAPGAPKRAKTATTFEDPDPSEA